MRTEGHDEDRLRRALNTALEELDPPDRARLARIEQQLLGQAARRRPHHWWWALLGLGVLAGAAAGYWGIYGHWGGEDGAVAPPAATERGARDTDQGTGADGATGDSGERAGDTAGDERNPVIYIGE